MSIRELSEPEFLATFNAPMRRLALNEDPPVRVSLKKYLAEAIDSLLLPTSVDDIEIQYVYVAHGGAFTHVNFNWGIKNVFLVLVVDNQQTVIHGHRLLDLNVLYGLTSD